MTELFGNEKLQVIVNRGGEIIITHANGVSMRVTALKKQLQISSVEGTLSTSRTKRGFPAILLSQHVMEEDNERFHRGR